MGKFAAIATPTACKKPATGVSPSCGCLQVSGVALVPLHLAAARESIRTIIARLLEERRHANDYQWHTEYLR